MDSPLQHGGRGLKSGSGGGGGGRSGTGGWKENRIGGGERMVVTERGGWRNGGEREIEGGKFTLIHLPLYYLQRGCGGL